MRNSRYLIPFCCSTFCDQCGFQPDQSIGLRSPTADLSIEAAWAVVVSTMITAQIETSGFGGYLKGLQLDRSFDTV